MYIYDCTCCVSVHTHTHTHAHMHTQVVIPLYYAATHHSAPMLLNAACHHLLVQYNKVDVTGKLLTSCSFVYLQLFHYLMVKGKI